jgi:hypothetical protein
VSKGTRENTRSANPVFTSPDRPLRVVLAVANGTGRGDISHRLSTAFRNLIAVFG